MTMFVGEQFRIRATATEYGSGDVLDDTNVTSVTVSIYDREGTALVTGAAMVWDAIEGHWEYLWDTTGLSSGNYRYQVKVVGVDGKPSWEWKKVRLAKNPV